MTPLPHRQDCHIHLSACACSTQPMHRVQLGAHCPDGSNLQPKRRHHFMGADPVHQPVLPLTVKQTAANAIYRGPNAERNEPVTVASTHSNSSRQTMTSTTAAASSQTLSRWADSANGACLRHKCKTRGWHKRVVLWCHKRCHKPGLGKLSATRRVWGHAQQPVTKWYQLRKTPPQAHASLHVYKHHSRGTTP